MFNSNVSFLCLFRLLPTITLGPNWMVCVMFVVYCGGCFYEGCLAVAVLIGCFVNNLLLLCLGLGGLLDVLCLLIIVCLC